MGPRPDGRGRPPQWLKTRRRDGAGFNGAATGWPRKVLPAIPTTIRQATLQWGRDRMAAEGWRAASAACSARPLQRGRDRMAAEGARRAWRG